MYSTYTIKHLRLNENIFNILDGWMAKYQTSPNKFSNGQKETISLSIEWSDSSQIQLEKDNLITELKKWADINGVIVIISSFAILVASSTLLLKTPIIYPSNIKNTIFEITPGVYRTYDNMLIKDQDTVLSLPCSLLTEELIKKGSIDQIIEEYTLQLEQDASLSSQEVNQTDDLPIELPEPLIKADIPTNEPSTEPVTQSNTIEQPTIIYGNNGKEIYIPVSITQTGVCRNYTNYTYFYDKWSKGTNQRIIANEWGAAGKTSSNGIATLNGRYLVAVSRKFGNVGDNIDIVLSDGQIIPATIADMKGSDATNEWGHVLSGKVDIIEWESSGPKSEINLGSWKGVTVEKIVNIGKYTDVQIASVDENYEEPANTENIKDTNIEELDNTEKTETINTEDIGTIISDEQQYIKLYSEFYGLNETEIYQILSDMTDGFNSEQYIQHNIIGRINDETAPACENKEMAIALAIRDIYNNPEKYGITYVEINNDNINQSSTNYEQQIEHLSNIFGVDPVLNYSICKASCNFDSPMFEYKNNPTNIKIASNYQTFPTPTAGFIEQTAELYELLSDGKNPLETIGSRVSTDSDNWSSNVLDIYNYVANNYDDVFETNQKKLVLF